MANLGYVSSFNINGNELSLKDAALTEIVEEIVEAIGANNGDISDRINNLHERSFDALIKIESNNDSEISNIQDGMYKLQYVTVTGEGDNAVETLNNSAILIQKGTNQYLYKDGQISSRIKTDSTWGNWTDKIQSPVIISGTGEKSVIHKDSGSTASGIRSYAGGENSSANSKRSRAYGYYCIANGENTTAIGCKTQTSNDSELAVGRFNQTSNSNSRHTLFSVGNSDSENDRKNALEVTKEGDIYFKLNNQEVELRNVLTLTMNAVYDLGNNMPSNVSDLNNDSGYITSETQLSKGTATGAGNAVTDINVSNHEITLVKGATYATQSDIDTSIAALVDSAPETLNTLNELAAALGDDANFATTVANQIGAKYTKPNTGIPASDLADGVIPDIPVTSVNGQTGAVILNADDVKAVHDYSKEYLTFTALQNTTFTFSINALQYSLDDGTTWTTLAVNTASPTVNAGNKILWKQTGLTPTSSNGIGTFSATGNFEVSGNIMSLYYGDNFIGQTNLTGKNYAFYRLFYGCSKLINTENLILPSTTLAESCYQHMFYNCTSLTKAPELPGTTLANKCYQYMFRDCTSLVTAPELPATTLTYSCYDNMFYNCTSLTIAPKLPATTLIGNCYSGMFSGCTSLVTASELPATTLTYHCYTSMFSGCTSLTIAPELPATTLEESCYSNMFKGCTSLIIAPELPATVLAQHCYDGMFYNCTSLTAAPELPATILANSCYDSMFFSCKSLTKAPELPAIILTDSCYINMFMSCTKLNYIKCLASSISASWCTNGWLFGVAATGTFIKADNMTSWTISANGIHEGWTVYTESEWKEVRHYEISNLISNLNNLNVTHTFVKNIINSNFNSFKIWIDDFSQVSVEEMYDNYINENEGYKQYHLTQNTLTIDNITYYIWKSPITGIEYDYSADRAYILTTTNDYNELLSQSLSEDLNNDFISFGGFLNEESEESSYIDGNNRIQYLLDVEQDNDDLYIYVDNIKIKGFNDGQTIEDYIDDPETLGCNPYELTSDTIDIDGESYYIWERNDDNSSSNIHYLLTTTNDYETLVNTSVEASPNNLVVKPNNCIFSLMDEDNEIYETTTKNVIVKVE